MNYFPFDLCPRLSAIALDDKRLPRVFGEAVMMLSKAQFQLTGEYGPYSPGMPAPKLLIDWIKGEGEGWFVAWTREMYQALLERNGTARVEAYACTLAYGRLLPRFRAEREAEAPPLSFPNLARAAVKELDFTSQADTHDAYRNYMRVQWNGLDKRPCVWTHHGPPVWADNSIQTALEELGL